MKTHTTNLVMSAFVSKFFKPGKRQLLMQLLIFFIVIAPVIIIASLEYANKYVESTATILASQSASPQTAAALALRHERLRPILLKDGIILLISVLCAFLIVRTMNAINLYRQKEEIFLESVADGLVAIDKDWNIMLWNRAATTLSGWHPNEAYGQPLRDRIQFVEQKTKTADYGSIEQALRSGAVSTLELNDLLITKEGRRIPIGHSAAPVFDQSGKVAGAIIVFRDITEEKAIEQAKTEFVSLVSHQLRTPLSAIGWYAELLLNEDAGKMPTEQKEYVKEIYHGNQRMVDLVNALLNMSRIEMGTLAIEPEPSPIIPIAQSVVKELAPQTREKNLALVEKYDKHLPLLNLDPKLTRIIFQNLLTNAIKYTPGGGSITVRIEKKSPNLRITVADNGLGIPLAQQTKIFTKLFRADNVREKVADGTGLGLYIVKSVLDRAGGKIWFKSKENKGTTFFVTLPLSGMKAKAGTKGLTA